MASSKLLDFLLRTANDPALVEDIKGKIGTSRAAFISLLENEHGLTDEQAAAVADEDLPTIGRQISTELVGGAAALEANMRGGFPIPVTINDPTGCHLMGLWSLRHDDE
jgi:hypothetical protein